MKKQLRNMTDKGYIARNAADGSWNVFAVTALCPLAATSRYLPKLQIQGLERTL